MKKRIGNYGNARKEITWAEDEKGCHICTSHYLNNKGYPKIYRNDKKTTVQRFLMSQFYELTPDIHILHKCDTPSCINLNHLFLGSNLDNVKDKVSKKRCSRLKGKLNPNWKGGISETYRKRLRLDNEKIS